MTKRPSLDEMISRRKLSAGDDGQFYKAVVIEDAEGEARGYDPEARAQRFVMSSESIDLYGDIVRQDGLDITNFLKNPVGLAYHNHRAPIGKWSDLKTIRGKPKRTEGLLTLFAEGISDDADAIGRLLGADAIRACSIGFKPVDAEWILDEQGRNTYGIDFTASILLECSVCSIPANPDALGKAAGGDMRLAAELFERVLDTYCERTTGGLFVRKEFEDAYMAMKAPKTLHIAKAATEGREQRVYELSAERAAESKDRLETQLREFAESTAKIEETMSVFSKFAEAVRSLLGIEKEAEVTTPAPEPETPVSEPAPAQPVLIKGSRAKANAKTAKLRASLRSKGLLD